MTDDVTKATLGGKALPVVTTRADNVHQNTTRSWKDTTSFFLIVHTGAGYVWNNNNNNGVESANTKENEIKVNETQNANRLR